ncbi:MAG TPA: IS1634 family transposase, partial [Methylococcaceae bacterium]|nr:IS1634 family transposase [Methylococcaceae bacterium]
MFIRRTQISSSASGEQYVTYRLVRSERSGGKVRQITLLNLGRYFPIAPELWSALCRRVEELLAGQARLLGEALPKAVALEAEHIAAQLLAAQAPLDAIASSPTTAVDTAAPKPATALSPKSAQSAPADFQTVDVASLELARPRSVGVEHTGLAAMRQLGFTEMLIELGLSGPLRAAVVGSIIGRMAAPGSEAATYRWLGQHSALGELLDIDFERMKPITLYRASDALMKHRDVIERTLFNRVHDLFGFETTVTMYDLTNTYFEGTAAANPKAQRGRSKEKRRDCPLVTLGLVLDGSGFVRRSQTFDGNASEGKTLAEMLKDLGAPPGALVVMDAGIATEANLTWLREHGYRYLVVSRERARQFEAETAIPIETATATGSAVHIQRVDDAEHPEVRLYCYSEQREQKERGINQRLCERFEAGLQKIAEGLQKPRAEKRLDQLQQRIGRLQEKYHGIGQHYTIELTPDETGEKAIGLIGSKQPKAGSRLSHPGVYCLRSNETRWDTEQLWRTYIMLTDLEAVFRSLKS